MVLGLRERMTNTTCTSVPDGKAFCSLGGTKRLLD